MKKILVTLDFDGVISPIDHDYDFVADSGFIEYRLGGFDCFVRSETVKFLDWLNSQENVDVVWATSWEDMTEHFQEDTGGDFPNFPYLPIPDSKAESILAEAVRVGADELHVFEDHARVFSSLKSAMKKSSSLYSFKLVPHKCETAKGLTVKKISSAKALIS